MQCKFFILWVILFFFSFETQVSAQKQDKLVLTSNDIETGASQFSKYFPLIQNKRIAVVANQTSLVGNVHLVDTLLSLHCNVKKIFCPEHGFRGQVEAGGIVNSEKDTKTNLPIVSLYGSHKKPYKEDLQDVDVILFDLQDVGVRFYTYISTMHYMMEACAENDKLCIILDRPNPNGFYVDGPVLDTALKSFIGMHAVPIVHGMTIGEYAQMINGENWLQGGLHCNLSVIPVQGYTHKKYYILPVKPSPNLPNMNAVYLYPSICLFEGTPVSLGRGTEKPFQIIGVPTYTGTAPLTFTPMPIKGVSDNPPQKGKLCKGFDLTDYAFVWAFQEKKINLDWLKLMYKNSNNDKFFTPFFDKLAGNTLLKQQIKQNLSEKEIRQSWEPQLSRFKEIRKKYLLYEDFE